MSGGGSREPPSSTTERPRRVLATIAFLGHFERYARTAHFARFLVDRHGMDGFLRIRDLTSAESVYEWPAHDGCALPMGMRKSLPPSPTPKNVSDAYAVRVAEQAAVLAGRDGRISAHEAAQSPEVLDAHRRSGRSRPVVRTVVEAARAAMLAEAGRVAGGDGRVSLVDSARMVAPLSQAFAALREIPREEDDAPAVVAELARLVEGLVFVSEADYVYEPFSVGLDPGTPLTIDFLQAALPWSEGPADQPEWVPPPSLRLEVNADDSFWLDEAEKEPYRAEAYYALDRFMKRSFTEETIRRDGESLTARIFSVTLPEADAALAPYFVLGRLASGELVVLRTFRVWT